MSPWPGAFGRLREKSVKVHATRVVPFARPGAPAGEVIVADKSRIAVASGSSDESIELLRVQLEGKKPVSAVDWYLGRGVKEGERFETGAPAQPRDPHSAQPSSIR